MRLELLSNASATGVGKVWPGGRGQFQVAGSLGGASVSLQLLGPNGATWLDLGEPATLAAAGVVNFELPPATIRAAVAGGSPAALYAVAVSL